MVCMYFLLYLLVLVAVEGNLPVAKRSTELVDGHLAWRLLFIIRIDRSLSYSKCSFLS